MDLKKLTQNIDYLVFKEGIQINVTHNIISNNLYYNYVGIQHPNRFPFMVKSLPLAFSKIVSFLKVKNHGI